MEKIASKYQNEKFEFVKKDIRKFINGFYAKKQQT